jgi:hypothetical protein
MGTRDKKLLEKNWSRVRGSMQGLQSGKKSFGIMRVAKIKSLGNMGASLQHTLRERNTPNADPERIKNNTVLLGGETSKEVLSDWKARAPEKIRSNAVHGLEYFVGGSPEKLKSMTREEQDAYFEDALDWIKERHGKHNVLSAVVHRDETTPHMSVMTIPLDKRGKLNARSFIGNKKALSDLQTDFAEKVSEQYGLRRGIKGSTARHERVQRVYGAYSSETDAVALPERARGVILGVGKESDADWHARASEEATTAVTALMLEMLDRERASDTKLALANTMIETLETLAKVTSDDLGAARDQLSVTRDTLSKLVASLELADKGKEVNGALKIYDKMEQQILDGDLTLLKEAAGSDLRMAKLVEMYNHLLPPNVPLTQDQQRFRNAAQRTIDGMENGTIGERPDPTPVAIDVRPLPHVRKALDHTAKDRINPPFETETQRTAFRTEIESSLSDQQLNALRGGDAGVLANVTGGPLEDEEQLRLAIAYFQNADIEVPREVLLNTIEQLAELESKQIHKSGPDTGTTH